MLLYIVTSCNFIVLFTCCNQWSRPVRELLGAHAHEAIKVKTLVVAMPGAAQQFVQQLAASWTPVGTLVTTDQVIVHELSIFDQKKIFDRC